MVRLALFSLLIVAPAPVEKGSLRLTTLPGVAVEWEGFALGETGADGVLWVRDIPPGDYTLTLSKPGYRPRSSRLTIARGETAVSLGLERLPAPRPVPQPRAAKPPPPRKPAAEPVSGSQDRREASGADPAPEPVQREPAVPRVAAPSEAVAPPETAGPPPTVVVPAAAAVPQLGAPPPAAAAEPVPASRTAAAGGASGAPGPLILVLMALSAALALVIGKGVRQRAAAKRKRHFRRPPGPKRLPAATPPAGEPPVFLEDLKRREEYVEAGVPEIIEVTDVEIVDDEP